MAKAHCKCQTANYQAFFLAVLHDAAGCDTRFGRSGVPHRFDEVAAVHGLGVLVYGTGFELAAVHGLGGLSEIRLFYWPLCSWTKMFYWPVV